MIDRLSGVPYTSAAMAKSISFWEHPIDRIEEALSIRKQIAALQAKLSGLFGSEDKEELSPAAKGKRGGRRTMSATTIAKMRAAQQARWAKKRGATASPTPTTSVRIAVAGKPAKKGKRTMSPEARARIAAAQRARWAKTKGQATSASAATTKPAKAKKRNISPEARAKMAAAAKKRWATTKAGK